MMPNRLAGERSAYLRSAAHQPVNWLPWGSEAFARAQREDKPVLLDIGAVWCHWCHVIDRESYDDPALAELINASFIAVKVDRDERPDVDARYQLAIQALTGQGGWPLTAFLTPEGKVFFGGTYFPPDDKYGRPGFRTVLLKVAEHYAKQREDVLAHAEALHQELRQHAGRGAPGELKPDMLEAAGRSLVHNSDPVNGGFGTAPKFPHPSAVELALARWSLEGDVGARDVALGALDGMARGGIRDHLGGGFHRYSVDAEWIVPHFEKMLYDNAGLLANYSHAWMLFHQPLHREAAEGIVAWLREVMADPRGGFAGSQDADVGLEDDGDYWTWTVNELRGAVPDAELQHLLRNHFDIHERGEMHHDPRKNVLFLAKSVERLAQEQGLPEAMLAERLAQGKALMLAARTQRPTPHVDRTLFASWNGMAASACLAAWKALGDPWCRDFALRTLDRLLAEAHTPGKGMAHVLHAEGGATLHGLLEDQVWVALALLEAYEVAGEERHLAAARDLLDGVMAHFRDADGALLDVAPALRATTEAAGLEGKRKPIEDAPHASANSVGALALLHAAALTGHAPYRDAAEGVLQAFAGAAPKLGLFASSWFLALDRFQRGMVQVVIAGDPGDANAQALHLAALRTPHPHLAVLPPTQGGVVPEAARAALESGVARQGPVALVCRGDRCEAPVRSPEALRQALPRKAS